ncbi:MAG TPA: acyltransferase [Verrucomicrobiae bacterium]|nr:acyltransferase [Verrucomicrobiae bacterium]
MKTGKPRSRQVDGLRAFAILGVIVSHFLPKFGGLPWGQIGVRLFFVISGFLITDILLGCRDKAELAGGNRWRWIRQFYCRRFLRIFPLYYFVIGLAFLMNLEPVRSLVWWLLTYTLNVQIAMQQEWPDLFSHFWSLCVEEQFYLLWPWCMLFLPKRWLLPLILATICVAPLLRFGAVYFQENWVAVYVFPGVSFDALGAGALVALSLRGSLPAGIERFLNRLALPLGVGLVVLLEILIRIKAANCQLAYAVAYDFGWSLVFYHTVRTAWVGFRGFVGRLCELRPLTYIGEISYGLYVYHLFVPALVLWLFREANWTPPHAPAARFWIYVAVNLVIASLSWHLFEKPLNNLKRHFPYQGPIPKTSGSPRGPLTK